MAVNITAIIGNLGRDPEVRETKNGGRVANLAVAVNEYRGRDNDEVTHWYNVVAWGVNADTAENLEKGDRVVVIGKMVSRKWEDQEGNTRYSTELVASDWDGVVAPAPAPEKQTKRRRDEDRSSSKKTKSRPVEDEEDLIPFAWLLTLGIGASMFLSGIGGSLLT